MSPFGKVTVHRIVSDGPTSIRPDATIESVGGSGWGFLAGAKFCLDDPSDGDPAHCNFRIIFADGGAYTVKNVDKASMLEELAARLKPEALQRYLAEETTARK